MLKAQDYLDKFDRWNQISEIVSDEQALQYLSGIKLELFSGLFKILTLGDFVHPKKLIRQNDLEGRAKLLHEKEEIIQFAQEGYSIDEVVEMGSFGINSYERDKAHRIAANTEINFLKYISENLGHSPEFGLILALTSPFYQVRFVWSPRKIVNLGRLSEGHNIPGVDRILKNLNKKQVYDAIKIHKAFGAKYMHSPEEIYKALL